MVVCESSAARMDGPCISMAWTCWSRAVALVSSAASLVVVWATSLSAFSRAARTSSPRPACWSTNGPAGCWPLGLVGGAAAPGIPVSCLFSWGVESSPYSCLPPCSALALSGENGCNVSCGCALPCWSRESGQVLEDYPWCGWGGGPLSYPGRGRCWWCPSRWGWRPSWRLCCSAVQVLDRSVGVSEVLLVVHQSSSEVVNCCGKPP